MYNVAYAVELISHMWHKRKDADNKHRDIRIITGGLKIPDWDHGDVGWGRTFFFPPKDGVQNL